MRQIKIQESTQKQQVLRREQELLWFKRHQVILNRVQILVQWCPCVFTCRSSRRWSRARPPHRETCQKLAVSVHSAMKAWRSVMCMGSWTWCCQSQEGGWRMDIVIFILLTLPQRFKEILSIDHFDRGVIVGQTRVCYEQHCNSRPTMAPREKGLCRCSMSSILIILLKKKFYTHDEI